MIRETISSATVLLLAYTGKNLRYFSVRRNAIILRLVTYAARIFAASVLWRQLQEINMAPPPTFFEMYAR